MNALTNPKKMIQKEIELRCAKSPRNPYFYFWREPSNAMHHSLCFALKELLADGPLPPSALLELTLRGVNRRKKILDPGHDVVAAVVPAHRTRL
jgi:hypothetical protein